MANCWESRQLEAGLPYRWASDPPPFPRMSPSPSRPSHHRRLQSRSCFPSTFISSLSSTWWNSCLLRLFSSLPFYFQVVCQPFMLGLSFIGMCQVPEQLLQVSVRAWLTLLARLCMTGNSCVLTDTLIFVHLLSLSIIGVLSLSELLQKQEGLAAMA